MVSAICSGVHAKVLWPRPPPSLPMSWRTVSFSRRIILAAGGTTNYVPISSAVQSALQQVVALMASAGAGSDYSVTPLFAAAAETRFAAILKEVPQNG
jgi:hypothetical protein